MASCVASMLFRYKSEEVCDHREAAVGTGSIVWPVVWSMRVDLEMMYSTRVG